MFFKKTLFEVYIIGLCAFVMADQKYLRVSEARIEGPWTLVNGIKTAASCCSICHQHTGCVGVNYNKDSDACEMITKTSPTELFDVVSYPTWTLYYIHLTDIDVKSTALAWQSSVVQGGVASRAIDGIKLDRYIQNSCTHTNLLPDQWWMVDLQRVYVITGVIVWDRNDPGATNRFRNIVITVSQTDSDIDLPSNVCTTFPGPRQQSNPITLPCVKQMNGRFLKIMREENLADFNICEVDFY